MSKDTNVIVLVYWVSYLCIFFLLGHPEEKKTEAVSSGRKSSSYVLYNMFVAICGVSETSANAQIDIPIEKRKTFLTETSERVQTINKALAIFLVAVISFLMGYYQ